MGRVSQLAAHQYRLLGGYALAIIHQTGNPRLNASFISVFIPARPEPGSILAFGLVGRGTSREDARVWVSADSSPDLRLRQF
jgi:hypothetical protein